MVAHQITIPVDSGHAGRDQIGSLIWRLSFLEPLVKAQVFQIHVGFGLTIDEWIEFVEIRSVVLAIVVLHLLVGDERCECILCIRQIR